LRSSGSRIGVTGLFDTQSRSQVLRGVVLSQRLEQSGRRPVLFSPTGRAPALPGGLPAMTAGRLVDPTLAGFAYTGTVLPVGDGSGVDHLARPDDVLGRAELWLLPVRATATAGTPLVWDAPAVPRLLRGRSADVVLEVASSSSYVSVSDRSSALRLRAAGVAGDIHVVPDPVLDVVRTWAPEKQHEARRALAARLRLTADQRPLVVHLDSASAVPPDATTFARLLDRLARQLDARPCVLIMSRKNDALRAEEVVAAMASSPSLLVEPDLREVLAVVRLSVAYVGSSYHGLAMAAAMGVPAVAVAGRGRSSWDRPAGLLEQFGLEGYLARSWDEAEELLAASVAAAADWARVPALAVAALDRHWSELLAALAGPPPATATAPDVHGHMLALLGDAFDAMAQRYQHLGSLNRGLERQAAAAADELHAARANVEAARAKAQRTREFAENVERGFARLEPESADAEGVDSAVVRLAQAATAWLTPVAPDSDVRRSMRRLERDVAGLAEGLDRAAMRAHRLARSRTWRLGSTASAAWNRMRGSAHWDDAQDMARRLDKLAREAHRMSGDIARARGGQAATPPRRRGQGGASRRSESDLADLVVHEAETSEVLATAVSTLAEDGRAPASAVVRHPRHHMRSADEPHRVDIVVCVHDALPDVMACLASVVDRTNLPFHLIVVDDGSGNETASFLDRFAQLYPVTLVRRPLEVDHGYTMAANEGLRTSKAELVVLLNSDTIVTTSWLDRLVRAADRHPGAAVFGPLSNAATHQSVPLVREAGEWATNPVPGYATVEGIALALARIAEPQHPPTLFLNGFCLLLRLAVLDEVGLLDEANFASGYAEESDLAIRVRDAGYELRVVDDAYVFHAKSRSYGGSEGRKRLSKPNYELLLRKHGEERVRSEVETLERQTALQPLRQRLRQALASEEAFAAALAGLGEPLRVTFLLAGLSASGSGGVHSVVQEAETLRRLGAVVDVLLPKHARERGAHQYPGVCFRFYADEDELVRLCEGTGVVVATHYSTVRSLARVCQRHPSVRPAYYVQDYEPLFCERPDELEEALASYTLVSEAVLFAKTEWLRQAVVRRHGVPVHKVRPSLDRDVYHPWRRSTSPRLRITAMVRPRTPRRQPWHTLHVLAELAARHGDAVEVSFFGAQDEQVPGELGAAGVRALGVLTRDEVAQVLRAHDLFLDLSTYQAFGRTALEAMACGCVPVVPALGGAHEFAVHERNALVVDTTSTEAVLETVVELLSRPEALVALQEAGLQDAANFTALAAAVSEYSMFTALPSRTEER
jgi:GT2 family glycosyltransferase